MAQFQSYEPPQRGVPTGRYVRNLQRTNGLVQDDSCFPTAPAVAPPPPPPPPPAPPAA